MKKSLCIFLLSVLLLPLTACTLPAGRDDGKLQIVATLFPQWDFARTVGGEFADCKLLIAPGAEVHAYEPSAADLVAISECDLFLYTGDEMEPWAARILKSTEGVTATDLSKNVTKIADEDGDHAYDPHIWTSPKNAQIMVRDIADAFCVADPIHETEYRKNAEKLIGELQDLDEEFREICDKAENRVLAFGGRFALTYFAEEYGICAHAAFDSCASETEPSVQTISNLCKVVKEYDLPVVFYEELTDPKVARTIAEQTGTEILLFHSCHNVSAQEAENGETYLTLMHKNAENLRKGLNVK